VTSHSPIAGARLFSEVVTDEEGRAMTLDSVPSEARPPDSHHPRPWGCARRRSSRSHPVSGVGTAVATLFRAPARH
jgi:hypothetical protein